MTNWEKKNNQCLNMEEKPQYVEKELPSWSKKEPQNVLVTGGGGFLGSAIVRRLVARGDRVTSLSRSVHPELERLGVRQVQADLADAEAVAAACRGVALVFHVAARTGVWGPYESYYRTNVTGTLNVIAACRRHHIRRLVYTSSPSVVFNGRDMEGADENAPYPDHYPAPYPETKALAEKEVIGAADAELHTIVLRPHLIWGPRDTALVPRILARAGRLARIGDGRNRVDTIYIDNAADAHLLAAERLRENPGLSGKAYFISQDDPIPLWDMVDAILKAGGRPPVRRSVSRRTAWIAGLLLEAVHKVLHVRKEPLLTRFVAEELATSHWFDIRAAKRDLGYEAAVSTAQGLQRLSRWLEENGKKGRHA